MRPRSGQPDGTPRAVVGGRAFSHGPSPGRAGSASARVASSGRCAVVAINVTAVPPREQRRLYIQYCARASLACHRRMRRWHERGGCVSCAASAPTPPWIRCWCREVVRARAPARARWHGAARGECLLISCFLYARAEGWSYSTACLVVPVGAKYSSPRALAAASRAASSLARSSRRRFSSSTSTPWSASR